MKKIITLITVLLAVHFNGLQAQQIEEHRRVIIIDPGHGGTDSGAISNVGLKEKDVVLAIAKELLNWNNILLDNKYEIYLTRSKDTLISLGDRTKLAGYLKPDIFISLHCNHSVNSKAIGIEIYIYKVINGNTEQSVRHAKTMADQLNQKLGFKNRGTKKANYQVLRETFMSCPTVLLELGFLSNIDESNYLEQRKKRKALALAILMSI